MKQARALMIQGTASDVGKSLLVTAFCRIFSNRGLKVAPFKSQNMALNSYITLDGKEIGRAQGVQAEAARTVATTDMNPILLKPKQDMISEVIVHGKRVADLDARYYRDRYVKEALPIVREALANLKREYELIILEGAGSPAEINLRDRDIANMRMAQLADAAVILVADIERGGVFASLIGTLALLSDEERARVKGFIINKFRGRRELLDDGLRWLEDKTGIPVLGVLPYLDVKIEAEDSLALSALRLKRPRPGEFPIDVAILRLPRISNFTDFDPLFDEPGVGVRYVRSLGELGEPDVLVIPGTKNTVEDLAWLRRERFDQAILALCAKGVQIIGICGGYQMLGRRLDDPQGIEGAERGTASGLALLPVDTLFQADKRTVRVSGRLALPWDGVEEALYGYEIHLGISRRDPARAEPFLLLADGREDGAAVRDGQVFGTYLHGLFHNRSFTRALFNRIRRKKGLLPVTDEVVSEAARRENAYEQLAEHVSKHVDLQKLCRIIGLTPHPQGKQEGF